MVKTELSTAQAELKAEREGHQALEAAFKDQIADV